MARAWYILHTYTGYEGKIERTIRSLIETGEIDSKIVLDVVVPLQEVERVTKTGKHTKRNEKFLPGYLMLEMDFPDDSGNERSWKPVCSAIRAIQGVTGFVGTKPNDKPRPISSDEAKNLLVRTGDIKGEKTIHAGYNFMAEDRVKIIDGALAGFSGVVEEVRVEQEKLRINVEIFNRVTPVELGYTQVEKI